MNGSRTGGGQECQIGRYAWARLAQSQNNPLSNLNPFRKCRGTLPQPYRFWGYEVEAISGAYAIANGGRIKVEPGNDGIVAQIGKRRPLTLVAVSPDKCAARDGNVIMDFNRGPYGADMVMSCVPDQRTAQAIMLTSTDTLAQR